MLRPQRSLTGGSCCAQFLLVHVPPGATQIEQLALQHSSPGAQLTTPQGTAWGTGTCTTMGAGGAGASVADGTEDGVGSVVAGVSRARRAPAPARAARSGPRARPGSWRWASGASAPTRARRPLVLQTSRPDRPPWAPAHRPPSCGCPARRGAAKPRKPRGTPMPRLAARTGMKLAGDDHGASMELCVSIRSQTRARRGRRLNATKRRRATRLAFPVAKNGVP